LHGVTPNGSIYPTDTFSPIKNVSVAVAGRFNRTTIRNNDILNPVAGRGSLTGDYTYTRFDPSVGITYNPLPFGEQIGASYPSAPAHSYTSLESYPATGQWVVSVSSSSVFVLNNSAWSGSYASGGQALHVGFATAGTITDNTVLPNPVPDSLTLHVRLESLSAAPASVRFVVEDAYDSASGETVCQFNAFGATELSIADVCFVKRKYELPDLRVGNPGSLAPDSSLHGGWCDMEEAPPWLCTLDQGLDVN
jgi:hypothetical protein